MDTSVNKTVNSGPNGVLIIEVSLYVHTINVHTIYVRTCTYVRMYCMCLHNYVCLFLFQTSLFCSQLICEGIVLMQKCLQVMCAICGNEHTV